MRGVLSLVFLTGFALVCRGAQEKCRPARPAVPVLKAVAVDKNALKQVTTAAPKMGAEVSTPVSSLEAGLPHARKTADRPILAMAESGGWFFYATSVVSDEKTGAPVQFISGYAVKRDGRHVVGFSVW